jgi:hypothetical protein
MGCIFVFFLLKRVGAHEYTYQYNLRYCLNIFNLRDVKYNSDKSKAASGWLSIFHYSPHPILKSEKNSKLIPINSNFLRQTGVGLDGYPSTNFICHACLG